MLKLAVFISGTGRLLNHILTEITDGRLATSQVSVELVVASRADVAGLAYADAHGVTSRVFVPRKFPSLEAHSHAVFEVCRDMGTDLVVLAGYLTRLVIPPDFENRVVNIHPSLIPSFSGHGFYGHRVHQAAIDYGVKVSGCTVHFVDNEYDHGAVILQRAVAVDDNDTAATLAARVFEQEKIAYIEAIASIAAGEIAVSGRRVVFLNGGGTCNT